MTPEEILSEKAYLESHTPYLGKYALSQWIDFLTGTNGTDVVMNLDNDSWGEMIAEVIADKAFHQVYVNALLYELGREPEYPEMEKAVPSKDIVALTNEGEDILDAFYQLFEPIQERIIEGE